jgi:1-acyl-sn-glycerol-3-phosphate acyltransferase
MLRLLRWVLLFFFRQVVRVYFRKVEVQNAPARSVERRLFGANHVNGIIDPMLVMTATWCRIAPLAKAPLWKIPGLNLLLRAAEAVPVVRRQDEPGKGEGSNKELFRSVARHLESGANVLIFPEGISRNEPHVVRLKTGAGPMLVGAREQGVQGLRLRDDLTELVIEGATWEERELIARVAELLAHESGDRTLAGWNSISRSCRRS